MALDLSRLNEIDLSNIDLKDLARAPLAVRGILAGALFLLIVAGGHYLVWADGLQQLKAKEREEQTLRDSYTAKKRRAIHYEAYKKRLDDTEKALAAMLRQLPDKAEMDALLADINQAGVGRGLEFQLFKPGQEREAEFYVTLPVSIKVSGGYHDIALFVSDVARLSRIVTLHDISLAPVQGEDDLLTMDATIHTYRYRDTPPAADKSAAKGGA